MEALRRLQENIARIGSWLTHYRELDEAEFGARIVHTEREGRLALAQYDRMAGTGDDRRFGVSLRQRFDVMMGRVSEVLVIERRLAESRLRFGVLRRDINGLLDDQLQKLAVADASAPIENADRTVSTVIRTSAVLIPVFLLTVAAVAALLTRSVTRSVHRLIDGTAAVAGGNLAHRITVSGDDELSDLAREFNAMVAQLEATTASKAALQASESRLQETVAELRHEILERGRAEAARASLERELRRSELMSAMGSLVAGVAHEVRNPLFGISSIIDALEARVARFGASGEYARHVALLRSELQRLTRLMQDLLDYGKPASLDLAPVALGDVVRAAMSACQAAAARQHVHVTQRIRVPGVAVMMDRARVVQVFQNLLDNAIQYTAAEGEVTLTVDCVNERGTRWVRCRVDDSGPGFPDEDLARVFEPFFTRRPGGTGLGLSIVLRIVEAHRGTVRAENRPGGGAAVEVRLPVVEVPAFAGERGGA
ncbi:MAG: PAS domain-containing sensor histidine kinase [Vicinamibacterales bacterium]